MRLRPSLNMMPAEPQCVIRHLPGPYRDEPVLHRDEPGLHRESIKMFNTSGMKRESPGRTGNDRRGNGNNRDGTLAPPGPKHTPAELRQRPGRAPVNAGRVPL
ncbi:hypothetical protein DPMN_005451 [Dreissena polymorpha]|uniref:Uncharacterized protein n=1 Tax=Dreissena polymorpha TaxID=45954 RepID=A0A9D4MQD9_DREPO|nr:hypothetical protein DPMN_005451 [Dreissena polymorpha]